LEEFEHIDHIDGRTRNKVSQLAGRRNCAKRRDMDFH
jgi:hypothetical protein